MEERVQKLEARLAVVEELLGWIGGETFQKLLERKEQESQGLFCSSPEARAAFLEKEWLPFIRELRQQV